ncbi:MAG: hypothetical protein WC495_03510 [Patescibacteria group bacterium]|jgi:hypothetical protein
MAKGSKHDPIQLPELRQCASESGALVAGASGIISPVSNLTDLMELTGEQLDRSNR